MKQYYIVGMIVIILLMLWYSSDLLKASGVTNTNEGFQVQQKQITLNFCPQWAPQIQTAKGNTDCCEGELLDGKCSSRTFCSLSPPHDNVPSCVQAWKQYFAEKDKQCPTTLPNYFENVKQKSTIKGCSASKTKEDGSAPQQSGAKRCTIYPSEKQNREMADSCFVEKERLKVQCPAFAGFTSQVEKVTVKEAGVDKFGSFVCAYSNSLGQRNSCNDEKSLIAMWDRQTPNWRMDKSKYTQLNNVSCRTFLDRERKKEMERQRLEAERRKREEAERKLSSLRSLFDRFKRSSQEAAEKARRAAEEQRKKLQLQIQQLQNRAKKC